MEIKKKKKKRRERYMEREVLGQKDRKRRCRKVEKSRDWDLLADVLQINKTGKRERLRNGR